MRRKHVCLLSKLGGICAASILPLRIFQKRCCEAEAEDDDDVSCIDVFHGDDSKKRGQFSLALVVPVGALLLLQEAKDMGEDQVRFESSASERKKWSTKGTVRLMG
jgi:hypothetical protein